MGRRRVARNNVILFFVLEKFVQIIRANEKYFVGLLNAPSIREIFRFEEHIQITSFTVNLFAGLSFRREIVRQTRVWMCYESVDT